jgi:hypothetical protein
MMRGRMHVKCWCESERIRGQYEDIEWGGGKDNIKTDVREVGCGFTSCIHVTQNRNQ